MNLMYQSLPWWSWLTLLLVPPLIFLLYFLKLRRTPLKVPSTYLWSKAIEDMHVNSFWQRLRKNLLLFLQLLFALMLLMTCLRPGCDGTELVGERFIFLIDNSASMAATDTPSGGTRLEYAKTEIRNSINAMQAGSSAMLISFSDSANIQQSYTTNRSELIRKLDEIPQTQKTSDLNEALTAASGLANPGRSSDKESQLDVQVADALDAVLHIYSDGGVRKVPEFSPGALSPEYHAVGSVGDPPNNVGITAFSVGEPSDADGSVQVFARLQNSDDVDHTVSVSFYLGDSLQDAVADILVPAEGSKQGAEGSSPAKESYGSKGISFELTAQAAAVDSPTVVRLEIENDDVFMLDNEAFAVLNPPRKSNVLIVSENTPYFRYACKTDAIKKQADVEYQGADYLEDKEYLERSQTGFYDLVIYDSLIPKTMPQCNTMVWNELPPGDDWKRSEVHSPTPVFDYDATHPIMAAVKISSLTIVNSRDLEGPPGSLSLIGSTTGAIAMLGPREGYLDLVMGFSIVEEDEDGETSINSDWPKKISFPLFMRQVIENLSGVSLFSAGTNVQPGDLLTIRTSVPFDKVNVRSPSGDVAELLPQKNRSFIYSQTGKSGVYDVLNPKDKEIDQRIAVNLLDPVESDLEVREELELGYSNLERVASQVPKRKEFWPWLLLASLILLMAEWIIYNKRVFI